MISDLREETHENELEHLLSPGSQETQRLPELGQQSPGANVIQ